MLFHEATVVDDAIGFMIDRETQQYSNHSR
jgi:hypothetical protein